MRRVLIRVIIFLLLLPVIYWTTSIIKCEILTIQHWREFEGLDVENTMLRKSESIKVLEYSDEFAKVYYRDREGGDILRFYKKDDKWVFIDWNTIWSRTGSADEFMWPYIR